MKKLLPLILVAALLWFMMFSVWTKHWIPFWVAMPAAGALLVSLSFLFGGVRWQKLTRVWSSIVVGLLSAAVLWCVFWVGNYLSTRWFGFAQSQIDSIYQMKEGGHQLYIALILLLLVGPAEEIFWRGCVQRNIDSRYAIPIAATIYAFVHIWSFNFMLVMAAWVSGLFWGCLYKYDGRLLTVIISHAVWDVAAFVIFPL